MSKSNAFVVMTNGYCEKSYRYGCLLDRSSMVRYSRVDSVLMRRSFCMPLQNCKVLIQIQIQSGSRVELIDVVVGENLFDQHAVLLSFGVFRVET